MPILSRFKKQKAMSLGVDVFIHEIPKLLKHGRFIDACQMCLAEIQKYPHYLLGHLLLAECYSYLKDWDKAIHQYTQILNAQPLCLGAYRGLAGIYRSQDNYQKLLEINQLILKIDRVDIFTYEETQKLKNIIKESIPTYTEKEGEVATPTLAEIYFTQGLYKDAYRMYSILSKQYPNKTEFRKKMQEIKLSLATL